ncbi:MAG TPA: hypothetical protein VF862_04740 [Gemmatimonadales bacterium]
MSVRRRISPLPVLSLCLVLAGPLDGQVTPSTDCARVTAGSDHASMDHNAHMAAIEACEKEKAQARLPKQSGQAAFAAMGEIVRILDADPKTDWSKVDLEALRQHLIDMNEVTMHAEVAQVDVPGGFRADVTGSGATVGAIQRMLVSHARMLDQSTAYAASTELLPAGVRLTVTVAAPGDARAVARVRGLGVAGIITEGTHHTPHHLAIARGDAHPHGH